MKVFLLAGGFGTRISEYSANIPKPMIEVGGKPILWQIMEFYEQYGHNDFYIALGYKAEIIKDFFLGSHLLKSDFTINLKTGDTKIHQSHSKDWSVTLVDTGMKTMTGGRLRRMRKFVDNETVLFTYGDGLCDVDLDSLLKFHKSHNKIATMTAVRPSARFGELQLDGNTVNKFQEKPQMNQGWINGGYFIVEPAFFDFIEGDETVLEKSPLETLSKMGELKAYKHSGFWQCMDTKRDKDFLEELVKQGNMPWIKKETSS